MNIVLTKNEAHKLIESVKEFPLAKVLVIGDIILDHYVWGEVSRISPEAPVPVVEVKRETRVLGGAANVAHNLLTLGAEPILCGVVGNDQVGLEVINMMNKIGLPTRGIVVEDTRPTTVKTRVVAHSQQVVRFDREKKEAITERSLSKIKDSVRDWIGKSGVIVVSDYGKGVIGEDLMRFLVQEQGGDDVLVTVDPKVGNFEFYKKVDVITPNHHEAGYFCQFEINDQGSLVKAGEKMLEDLECGSVVITRGKDGMTIFEGNGHITQIPTMAKQVFDVTGAGDTVISTLSLGLSVGLDLRSSAILANFAAGVVVGRVGTYPIHSNELISAVKDLLKDE